MADKAPDGRGNVYLVGPMGAGKSSVGRKLANLLKRKFKDSDSVIEERTGASIPLIFEIEGESGFRTREANAIEELTATDNLVLATGGGAILTEKNRSNLRKNGFVVYLHASVNQQLQRAGNDRNRPLLQTDDPRATLEALFAHRDPLYRETAHLIVDTDRQSVARVAQTIKRALTETG